MLGDAAPAEVEASVVAQAKSKVVRDRTNPSLFDALAADPSIPIEREALRDIVKDLRRWSRRYLFPTIRVLVLFAVHTLVFVKRLIPFLGSLKLLSLGSAWFSRRMVSAEAQRILLRHFIIETNIVNFVARNSGGDVPEYDLLPTRATDLGEWKGTNSIALHDANIMNLFIDLGETPNVDVHTTRPLESLDFSMIEIPELHVEEKKVLFPFDLPSSIYISVFYIALLFDDATIERAINSFQLDESLLTCVANITGDDTFRTWTPVKFPTWLGSPTGDPARDLHFHILVHEYAHHRLLSLKAEAARRRLAS